MGTVECYHQFKHFPAELHPQCDYLLLPLVNKLIAHFLVEFPQELLDEICAALEKRK